MTNGRSEVIKESLTFEAGEDLSAAKNLFVEETSAGIVKCGDGEDCIGVLLENTDDNAYGSVALQNAGNVVRVIAGAVVARGARVCPDTAGKAKTAASGDIQAGWALNAGNTLDYIETFLSRGRVVA